MGDLSQDFKALNEARKKRHSEWHEENRKIIKESGIFFVDKGEALLFRNEVKADFYPSTGRWTSGGNTFQGGAKAFLVWYNKALEGGR